MSNEDTPRTDALQRQWKKWMRDPNEPNNPTPWDDFARQLERELNSVTNNNDTEESLAQPSVSVARDYSHMSGFTVEAKLKHLFDTALRLEADLNASITELNAANERLRELEEKSHGIEKIDAFYKLLEGIPDQEPVLDKLELMMDNLEKAFQQRTEKAESDLAKLSAENAELRKEREQARQGWEDADKAVDAFSLKLASVQSELAKLARENSVEFTRLREVLSRGRDAMIQLSELANVNQGTRDIIIGVANKFSEAMQSEQPRGE